MKIKRRIDLPFFPNKNIVYKLMPLRRRLWLYEKRTDRNIGWITREEQEMLKHKKVAVVGCGGIGSATARILHCDGIGELRIGDNDTFEYSNMNRQLAAVWSTIGTSKAFSTARMLRNISKDSTIVVFPMGFTKSSAEAFIDGVDIVCDEVEFWAIGSRILLHQTARKKGIPVLNCPTIGHRSAIYYFTPTSMPIEDILGFSYEEAREFETRHRQGLATKTEMERVKKAMFGFMCPELPEYSADIAVYSTICAVDDRLNTEGTASIIAVNPSIASGILASQVHFLLLTQSSSIKRNFVLPPEAPGFLTYDCALHQTKYMSQ